MKSVLGYLSPTAVLWRSSVDNCPELDGLHLASNSLPMMVLKGVQSSRKTRVHLAFMLLVYLISPAHTRLNVHV